MRLYCVPGLASQAPHIALREARLRFELVRVDPVSKTTSDGMDFRSLNPFGEVPLLLLNDGRALRETPVILRYIAELAPEARLGSGLGADRSLRLDEWLAFLGGDIHQGLRQLASADSLWQANRCRQTLLKRFAWIDTQLAAGKFLMPLGYTIADIYLWVLATWAKAHFIESSLGRGIGLGQFDNIRHWHERVAGRDAVTQALEAELSLAPVKPLARAY